MKKNSKFLDEMTGLFSKYLYEDDVSPERLAQPYVKTFSEETPILTEAQMTEYIRKFYPEYEPPMTGTLQARQDLRQKAVIAYVSGTAGVVMKTPYVDRITMDPRLPSRLMSFMASDDDRRDFAETWERSFSTFYSQQKKENGEPKYTPEQCEQLAKPYQEKSGKYWIENISRLLDEYEAAFDRDYTDEELVEAYPRLAIPIALANEAVKAMHDYGKYCPDYTQAQKDSLTKRAAEMMGPAVTLEKRIISIADPYYPIVNMDSLALAPTDALEKLGNELTDFIAEAQNLEDTDPLEASLENTCSVLSSFSFAKANETGFLVAEHYGYLSSIEMSKDYYFFDEQGKAFSTGEIPSHLSDGMIFTMRRDGSGEVEAVSTGLYDRKRLINAPAFGWAEIGAVAEPVPEMPVLSGMSRFFNWLSETFLGHPTETKLKFDREVALRQETIARNEHRQNAEHDETLQRTAQELKQRVNLLAQRQKAGDEYLAKTISEAQKGSMTRDDPETQLYLAKLVVSRLFTESMNSNSFDKYVRMFGMLDPDFSFDAAAEKLVNHEAFRTEFIDTNVLQINSISSDLQSGNPERIAKSADTLFLTGFATYFNKREWQTTISRDYLLKMRQAEGKAFLNDLPEWISRIELQRGDAPTRNIFTHLMTGCLFNEDLSETDRNLLASMLGTEDANFKFSMAANNMRGKEAVFDFTENVLLQNPTLVAEVQSGDAERLYAVGKVCIQKFAEYFRERQWDTPLSEKYRNERIALTHKAEERKQEEEKKNLKNAERWKSIENFYGDKRALNLEWTWLHGHNVYNLDDWKEMQNRKIDLETLKPDGAAVDNRLFCSFGLMLSQRLDQKKILEDKYQVPDTAASEDILMGDAPRDGIGRYMEVIENCRSTATECLSHMDEPLSTGDGKLTGREVLAQELAKALKEFEPRARKLTFTNRGHLVLIEAAENVLNFAKDHDMLLLLKDNGITDEMLDSLTVAAAMGKVATEGFDAAYELKNDALKQEDQASPEQRGEWITKMVQCKAMQVEQLRILSLEADIGPAPDYKKGESMAAYTERCMEYTKRQAAASDDLHRFSEPLKALTENRDKLDRLRAVLISNEELETLSRDSNKVLDMIKVDNGADEYTVNYKKALTKFEEERRASEARNRMYQKQCSDFRNNVINQLEVTAENQKFIDEVNGLLGNGESAEASVLMQLNAQGLKDLNAELSKDPNRTLQSLLKEAVDPHTSVEQQPQKSAPVHGL